jgi:ATP synthase protein I
MVTETRSLALQAVDVRRLLLLQLAIAAVATLAAFLGWGDEAAAGVAWGGGTALLSAWMLGRRVQRAGELARTSPGIETAVLYIGAIQRFAVVMAMFWLALGHFGLPALALLAGFGVAQLAYFVAGALARSGVGTAASRVEKWG